MEERLDNPVYHALISGDAALAHGNGVVRFFDESVSPFAGFPETYSQGFADLLDQLPPRRRILYASTKQIPEPKGWLFKAAIKGVQFLYDLSRLPAEPLQPPVPLRDTHVPAMVDLATLTRPGPFGPRTIAFGHYYGIFEAGRLAAMTGQRLHVDNYTEISAVCTHPDHLGKGFAAALLQHQLRLILKAGQQPFLHVREDNERAIALYERLGFARRGPMHFYFLEKRS